MQDLQEEQLFGAPPGACNAASINTYDYGGNRVGVVIVLHPINRKGLLSLRVTVTGDQGLNTVIGAMIPLMHRGPSVGVNFARRALWAMHNRLGAMGYEVEIKNCGREPKH